MVTDDGAGFAAPPPDGAGERGAEAGHFGLLGMRERAERLGGSFRIESAVGRGTTVVVDVTSCEYDRDLAEPAASAGH
jgi:signal transduction histidine kinase